MPYNAASDAVATAVTHASNYNVYALTINREIACGTLIKLLIHPFSTIEDIVYNYVCAVYTHNSQFLN